MSRRVVSVDPGKNMLGIAFWVGGELREAGWQSVDSAVIFSPSEEVVLERPRARRPEDTPGGQAGYQDLIDVAIAGALYAGHCGAPVRLIYPDEWKGGTKKPERASDPYVVELRCRKILTPEEVARVRLPSARGKQHNVWDAVGLGLFALGRCGRGVTSR